MGIGAQSLRGLSQWDDEESEETMPTQNTTISQSTKLPSEIEINFKKSLTTENNKNLLEPPKKLSKILNKDAVNSISNEINVGNLTEDKKKAKLQSSNKINMTLGNKENAQDSLEILITSNSSNCIIIDDDVSLKFFEANLFSLKINIY